MVYQHLLCNQACKIHISTFFTSVFLNGADQGPVNWVDGLHGPTKQLLYKSIVLQLKLASSTNRSQSYNFAAPSYLWIWIRGHGLQARPHSCLRLRPHRLRPGCCRRAEEEHGQPLSFFLSSSVYITNYDDNYYSYKLRSD